MGYNDYKSIAYNDIFQKFEAMDMIKLTKRW